MEVPRVPQAGLALTLPLEAARTPTGGKPHGTATLSVAVYFVHSSLVSTRRQVTSCARSLPHTTTRCLAHSSRHGARPPSADTDPLSTSGCGRPDHRGRPLLKHGGPALFSSLRACRRSRPCETGHQVPTRLTLRPEDQPRRPPHCAPRGICADLHHTLAPPFSKTQGRLTAPFSQHLS